LNTPQLLTLAIKCHESIASKKLSNNHISEVILAKHLPMTIHWWHINPLKVGRHGDHQ
jgi:hypothetical protein